MLGGNGCVDRELAQVYRDAHGGLPIKRTLTLLVLLAAVLSLGVGRSSAGIQKYFDGAMQPGEAKSSGWNYWQTNRVWRPIGEGFQLAFLNSVPGYHGAQYNEDRNPFTIYGNWGYSRGDCWDFELHGANPVTCQVYTYIA